MAALDAAAAAPRSTRTRPARRRCSTWPRTCAMRCGASTRRRSRPLDAPGGLLVAGMGGSSVGGRLAAARARRRACARPLQLALGYGVPALDRAGHARALLELLGRHGGDAGRLRRGQGARARRGSWPRPAGRSPSGPARTACPSCRCPAASSRAHAVGYSLVTALEAAALVRRRAVRARRRRRRRPRSPRNWPRSGARTPARRATAKRLARALHGSLPGHHGRRAHGAGRVPLEVPGQRERRPARVRVRAAGARPQRDRRLGAGPSHGSAPCSSRTPRPTRARALRIEVTAEIAARGAAAVERVRARGATRLERLVSLVLLGDVVSLYLAVLRGADPVARRRDRHAQGPARRRLSAPRGGAGAPAAPRRRRAHDRRPRRRFPARG